MRVCMTEFSALYEGRGGESEWWCVCVCVREMNTRRDVSRHNTTQHGQRIFTR